MLRIYLRLILLLALASWPAHSKVMYVEAAAGGGGGTDFTADAAGAAIGCWMASTTSNESASESDSCDLTPTLDSTWTDSTAWASTTSPDGSNGLISTTLDGDESGFCVAHTTSLESTDFTYGFWVNTSTSAVGQDAFSKDDNTAYQTRIQTNGTLRQELDNVVEITATAISTGTWYHVAVRYDGTSSSAEATDDEIGMFLNGVEDCTPSCNTVSGAPTGNASQMCIGSDQSTQTEVVGGMMEAFYFDRVLDQEEICEIVLCGLDGNAISDDRNTTFGSVGECDCDTITTCC